jgi:exodeoxyribonuclease VII large subunit
MIPDGRPRGPPLFLRATMNGHAMQQKGLDFGSSSAPRPRPRTLSVSQLTDRIQGVLETELADVWVEGEVSNLKLAPSGHWYFSLKDERSQVRAVVWKADTRLIRFRPQDGMRVVARGQVRVYAPRGEYQLQVQVLEPLGKGSLQQAFEELKERLGKEGLFEAARKRPLPALPRCVGVVSSPTGAVIQDILRVLGARYANLGVLLYPARVQGPEAAGEVAQGIRALNRLGIDVLIVARGGGSLEDLWAFNDEQVARALASSKVPTISAVGHETDFTIADFVADVRAATPSAAAERVVQAKEELRARVAGLEGRLTAALRLRFTRVRARVEAVTSHRVFTAERGRIHAYAQRVDQLSFRAQAGQRRGLERARERVRRSGERLEAFRWDRQILARRERLLRQHDRLRARLVADLAVRRAALARAAAQLEGLSPLAVLARGYALVWDGEGRRLVREASAVEVGEQVRVRLHEGVLRATVTARETT